MPVAYQDYYEALGVPRDASEQDIRRAYRKLAREHHPDVNKEPGAEDRFKEISEAYEVLRDKDKRERYDRLGANWKAGQDVSGSRGAGGNEEAFRGGDGFRDVHVDFGGGDFSDFFESFFAGQGVRGRRSGGRAGANGFSRRGGDQEATLELSLEEAASGGKRRLSLGDGRDFEVDIPRGVRDRQRIRLAGQGEPGRRRSGRRPAPARTGETASPVPRQRQRSLRRSPGLAVGGGTRCGGTGQDVVGHGARARTARLIVGPAAAPAR